MSAIYKYTEREMADSFLDLLQSHKGLPGIGSFDGIYREVNCHQGRPDFIALRFKEGYQTLKLPESIGLVGSSILTRLKPNSPRTLKYLVNNSEFSEDSIKRSLRQLISYNYVERTQNCSYCLGRAVSQFNVEIWTFELKLDNPKRAVFQAQQSRVYANHAMIVVPPGQEKHFKRYQMTMTRWGIGLSVFDPIDKYFHVCRRGRNTHAICPQYHIYALSQIAL